MWRQQQRTNRTIFPCPCKNCSVTAVRHIGHASASFQCFSTTANTVSQFIRLSQRPQLEPIPKARKRKRAVRSVCDCIMCSFSVVCDRYTNTSVTVTVTAVVFCIIVTVTCIVYELNSNYECHDCHDMTVMTCRTWHDITVSRTSSHRHTHRHRHTHTVSHTHSTLCTLRTHTLDKKWIIDYFFVWRYIT